MALEEWNIHTEVINQMDKNLIDPVFDAFTDIFSIVFSFLALITIHWSVGIVTILLFAVMMLLPGLLQKGVEKHSLISQMLFSLFKPFFSTYFDISQ